MKNIFLASLVVMISTLAMAEAPMAKMYKEIVNRTEFVQTTSEKRCPEKFKPELSQYGSPESQPEDIHVWFNYLYLPRGGWNHEEGYFSYRPGLKTDVLHVLSDRTSTHPVWGTFRRVFTQLEKDGVLVEEFTVFQNGVRVSTSRVIYDSNNDVVHTFFDANGAVKNVNCTFKK